MGTLPAVFFIGEADHDWELLRAAVDITEAVFVRASPATLAAALREARGGRVVFASGVGAEAAAEIAEMAREARPPPPIIAVASSLESAEAAALAGAGVDEVIARDELAGAHFGPRLRTWLRAAEAESGVQSVREAMDEMLSVVSHDLRNPLNAIAIAVEELGDASMDHEERSSYVAAVHRSVRRCDIIIRDLHDIGRIEAGRLVVERAPLSVAGLLEQCRSDSEKLAQQRGVEVAVAADSDVGSIMGDRERLRQLFGTLIRSSLKSAPKQSIVLRGQSNGELVLLSVIDDGPGIAPKEASCFFERYWRAQSKKRSSAELGLVIARGIVEAHGGNISALARDGGGEFHVCLPRS